MSVPPLALLTAEGGALAPLLIVPGTLALRRVLGSAWPRLPWHRRLAYGWLASVGLLAAVGASLQVVPVAVAQLAAWGLALATVLALLTGAAPAWRRRRAARQMAAGGPVAVVAVLFGASLWIGSLAEVPGPLVAGYGDLPAYYRVVENLSQGRGLLVDFRIGDYSGEIYRLPTAFPLLVWVGAGLRLLVPSGDHVVFLFCVVSGAVALSTFAGRLAEAHSGVVSDRAWLPAAFALVPLAALPIGLHFVLGAVTLPVLAMLLIAVDTIEDESIAKVPLRVGLAVAAALGAVTARPEGALIVGLSLGALAVSRVAGLARRARLGTAAVAVSLVVVALVAVRSRPEVPTLRGDLSLVYLHYQPQDGAFRWHPSPYVRWWAINFDNARESLGLPRALTRRNPDLLGQVARHPIAFARWVGETLWTQLGPLWLGLLVAAGAVAIAHGSWVEKGVGVGGILYAPVLLCLSVALSPRHVLPVLVTLVLIATTRPAVASRLARWPRALAGACAVAGCLGLAAGAWSTAEAYAIQRRESRVPYRRVLSAVRRHAAPDSLVATNYPPLVSYGADVRTVGNSILLGTLAALAERHRPNLIVIDDNRLDLPGNYERFKSLAQGTLSLPGYRVLVDSPADRFVLLGRNEAGGRPGG